jgi:hypothetical protein
MKSRFISLGAQCTVPSLFERLKIKGETLPFDWMISTPEFVYTILKNIVENMDISDILMNDFFAIDGRASLQSLERYKRNNKGVALVNSKHSCIFPHDTAGEAAKYQRRLDRLKQTIFNKDNYLYFVYVSVSSLQGGNYMLDNKEPIQNLYTHIKNISDIIKPISSNYKILVFDTTSQDKTPILNDANVMAFDIHRRERWGDLLPDLIYMINLLINDGTIVLCQS